MQFNKIMKGLLFAVPVLVITACSSKKNTDNNQAEVTSTTGSTVMSSDMPSQEQTRLKMQELQKNNTVYFGLDKYDVAPDFSELLDAHAEFLRNNPSYKVVVEGHTDERGTPEYNIALGERRANAVKMYLQGKGVTADQIAIVSYGKEKPVVLGHDEAAFARNRRAVLVY